MPTNTSSAADNEKPLPAPPPPPKDAMRPPIPRSHSHPASSTSAARPGDATTAYKDAQSMLARRATTPQGQKSDGDASSQACESGEVSESERGVMRKERKDVCHQGPGLGVWEGEGKEKGK